MSDWKGDYYHLADGELVRCDRSLSVRDVELDLHEDEDGRVVAVRFQGQTYELAPPERPAPE